MSVPSNIRRFEALLYASLMLDALSVAVQDRTPNAEMTEQMITTQTLLAGGMGCDSAALQFAFHRLAPSDTVHDAGGLECRE